MNDAENIKLLHETVEEQGKCIESLRSMYTDANRDYYDVLASLVREMTKHRAATIHCASMSRENARLRKAKALCIAHVSKHLEALGRCIEERERLKREIQRLQGIITDQHLHIKELEACE